MWRNFLLCASYVIAVANNLNEGFISNKIFCVLRQVQYCVLKKRRRNKISENPFHQYLSVFLLL